MLEIAAGGAWLLKYNFDEILHRKGRKVKATPYLHSPAFLRPLVLPSYTCPAARLWCSGPGAGAYALSVDGAGCVVGLPLLSRRNPSNQ